MSKLNIDQKTIEALFSDPKTDFLIPITSVRMLGLRSSAGLCGNIYSLLRFLRIIAIISRLPMNFS